MVDSNGELKKRINEDRKKYGGEDADYIVMERHLKVLDEAKKDFPMQELQFHDPRYTDECEQFTGHILAWYNKWFGGGDEK